MKVHINRHKVRWALFHVALVIFSADLIAAVWPAFNNIWNGLAHIAIALATVLACAFEYIGSIEETIEHNELREAIARAAKEAQDETV